MDFLNTSYLTTPMFIFGAGDNTSLFPSQTFNNPLPPFPPPPPPPPPPPLPSLSDQRLTQAIIAFVIAIPIVIVVSGFGIVTNIINLVVFYRQGLLADSCTPSLVGLALSDFGCCSMSFLEALLKSPRGYQIIGLPLPNRKHMISYALHRIVATPIPMFKQVTCFITAYLSLERMISVAFPFRVKSIFTPNRSYAVICSIFVVCFITYVPHMYHRKIVPDEIVGLYFTKSNLIPSQWIHLADEINNIALRLLSVFLVLVCNIIIVTKVNVSRKFKMSQRSGAGGSTKKGKSNVISSSVSSVSHRIDEKDSTHSKNVDNNCEKSSTNKETKLIKMMTLICVMFLVCYSPSVIDSIIKILKLYYNPLNRWIFMYGITAEVKIVSTFLELVNSCCNILLYYNMSTKFRKELDQFLKRNG